MLISFFVFVYAKNRFSHDAAHIIVIACQSALQKVWEYVQVSELAFPFSTGNTVIIALKMIVISQLQNQGNKLLLSPSTEILCRLIMK